MSSWQLKLTIANYIAKFGPLPNVPQKTQGLADHIQYCAEEERPLKHPELAIIQQTVG